MVTEPILAKGVNFLYAKRFIEEKHGIATWERVWSGLPEDVREVWSKGILLHKQYPFIAFKATMSSAASVLGEVRDNELARIYEYIADQTLNKVYRIFFSLANPAFVIRNYPKLWDMFFNTGKVQVPVVEKGHAVLKFILPEVFLDWLPPACLGYSRKAIEMGGGHDVILIPNSINKLESGEWEVMYALNWSE